MASDWSMTVWSVLVVIAYSLLVFLVFFFMFVVRRALHAKIDKKREAHHAK